MTRTVCIDVAAVISREAMATIRKMRRDDMYDDLTIQVAREDRTKWGTIQKTRICGDPERIAEFGEVLKMFGSSLHTFGEETQITLDREEES